MPNLFDNKQLLCLFLIFEIHFCSLVRIYQYTNSADRIRAVSSDRNFLTFGAHLSLSSNAYKIVQYDFDLNKAYKMNQNISVSLTSLSEPKNWNNLTDNTYLFSDQTQTTIFQNNISICSLAWIPEGSSYFSLLQTSNLFFLQYFQINSTVYLRQINIQTKNITSVFSYQQQISNLKQNNGYYYLFTKIWNNLTLLNIRVYNKTSLDYLQQIQMYNIAVKSNTKLKIQIYDNYLVLASKYYIQIYNFTIIQQLPFNLQIAFLKNISFSESILDIKIINKWVMVSTDGHIYQYNLNNYKLYYSMNTPISTPRINVFRSSGDSNDSCGVAIWCKEQVIMRFYNITDQYMCDGRSGCTCASGYCFDAGFTKCMTVCGNGSVSVYNFSTIINVTNGTGNNNNGNNTNTINNTNNVSNFTNISNIPIIPIPNYQSVYSYCSSIGQNSQCLTFCPQNCQTCSRSQCLSCSSFYTSQHCTLPSQTQVLLLFATSMFSIRANGFQQLYYFLDHLKYHNYHKTQYQGIIKNILDFTMFLQQHCWNLLNFNAVTQWINTPYPIQSYSYFTNVKFQYIQRSDSFFFQNTKSYFVINIPIVFLLFFTLNKVFYFLFKYKISLFFRIYSFWLHLLMIIVIQNLTMLIFLACQHFHNLFYFDPTLLILQYLTVFIIGVILIVSISFFFLCQYFYPQTAQNFLYNISKNKRSFCFMFVRFILMPIIYSTTHAYLYQNNNAQLLSLSFYEFIGLVTLIILQLKYHKFKIKVMLLTDLLIDGCLCLLNFILYLKNIYPDTFNVLQECTVFIIYLITFLLIYSFVHSIARLIMPKRKQQQIPELTLKSQNRFISIFWGNQNDFSHHKAKQSPYQSITL